MHDDRAVIVLAIKPRPENADSMVDMTPEHSGVMPERPTPRSEPPRPSETLAERLSRGASIPLPRDFAPTGTVEDHEAPGRHSISPELALVDPELSALARRELPDAPWLAFERHGSSAPAVTPASAPPTVVARDEPVTAPRPVPLERLPAPDEDDAGVTPASVRPLQLVPPPEQARPGPVLVAPPAATPAKVVSRHEHVPPPRVSAPAPSRTRRRRRYVTRVVIATLVASAVAVGMVWYQSPDAPSLTGPPTAPPAESVAPTGGSTPPTSSSAKTSGAQGAQPRSTKPKPPSLLPIRQRIAASGFTIASGGQMLVDARGREIVQLELSTPCGTIRVVGAPIDRRGGFRAKSEPRSGVTGDVRGRFVSARAATGRVALSGARCSARTLQFRANRS
jgi:hypothetical protein